MKTMIKTLSAVLPAILAVWPVFASAADSQLQSFPKNLARHHVGANLLEYNAANRTYEPTEVAGAWMDDDVATGLAPRTGVSYFLVALPAPELLTNVELSARGCHGTVNVYAGDEAAAPGTKSWSLVAREIPVEVINQRRLEKPFTRLAKYMLLEFNLAQAGSIYSLNVYGEKPAVDFHLEKRDRSSDVRAALGRYVNPQTAVNLSGLYTDARVRYSSSPDTAVGFQKAVDDNPETALRLAGGGNGPAIIVKLGQRRDLNRVSLLADSGAKGKMEFFLMEQLPGDERSMDLSETQPTVSIVMDGVTAQQSVEFRGTPANYLVARWLPEKAGQALTLRELDAFGGVSLNEYAVTGGGLPAVGERLTADVSKGDFKGGKEPIGEFIGDKTPYVPGAIPPPPPDSPVSP
jgi:hypothetical protein